MVKAKERKLPTLRIIKALINAQSLHGKVTTLLLTEQYRRTLFMRWDKFYLWGNNFKLTKPNWVSLLQENFSEKKEQF